VLFAVVSDTQYRWVVEDDQDPTDTSAWSGHGTEDWSLLTGSLVKSQAGTIQSLPTNVSFDDPANCGITSGTSTWAVRFTQLGSTCALGTGACGAAPQSPPTGTALIKFLNGTHTICLKENSTSLHKTVSVSSGGRVAAQP
jgi:hypothetical protein